MKTILACALLTALWASPAHSAIPPLSAELQEALHAIRADPRPKELVKGTHYVISNEPKQWLFRDALKDSGGLYVGVGAEQNYLFMGWSRPEVVVLMDFDELIPRLHDAYASIFRRMDTPEAFLSCWKKGGDKSGAKENCGHETVLAWIAEDYQPPRQKGVRSAWKFARPRVMQHLHDHAATYTKLGIPTFLTDLEQYTFVKEMVRSGRVHAVRGDVTKYRAMKDIAGFATKACLPVRTLYLSNVDDYINYHIPQHRKNMVGLPGDERSIVVQTEPSGGHTYHYLVQPLSVYRDWLQCKCVYAISVLRPYREPLGEEGLLTVKTRPADVKRYTKKAAKAGPAPPFDLPESCPRYQGASGR